MQLDAKIPSGPLTEKWDKHRFELKLVNPANKRKYNIIVVGTGLAGGAAAASLAELGYYVKNFCVQDSPRRAHSIAAQGGINAAKNYQNDGDSIWRLFYDTIKGGDFRAREANVYRLAQVSNNIIDQCVAQGVPFAREYGGLLANRSFGGAQVSRTFYARGQTGQQLLLGAYSSLMRQVAAGQVTLFPRREMLDLVVINGQARGILVRNLITGEIESHAADAVVMCTGGYANVFYLSTNAMASNVSATFRAYKKGAFFANPCYTQIHPTCIPVHGTYQSKLTLMSESLRNDGRVWVPKIPGDRRPPSQIPESERDYYLENKYPSFGNLVPRDVASRNAKTQCDMGKGVGETGFAVYLDFKDAIKRDGKEVIAQKYGNLFQMYEKITASNPYEAPMMIYPASHYVMGGLWVDYNLMSNLPGLFVMGEANFSDHGANRTSKLLSINGKRTVDDFHRELGHILWEYCGMSRNDEGLLKARKLIQELRGEFWENSVTPGSDKDFNQSLERAGRVADFLEFAELMVVDAFERKESCGGHFNEGYQTEENEAKRDDENFCHVAAWKYKGDDAEPKLHKEPLAFENVELTQRSYK